jgi:hypothetical protein
VEEGYSHQLSGRGKMVLPDKMEMWHRNLEDPSDKDIESRSIPHLGDETVEEPSMPNLQAYREAIFKSDAYRWLTVTLRRDFLLSPGNPDWMGIIAREIVHALPSSPKVSRKKSSETFHVAFEMELDLPAFLMEQGYPTRAEESILTALTITGSNTDAQALPCAQYILQTWPVTGEAFIKVLKHVVSNLRVGDGTSYIGTPTGSVDPSRLN